jgi:hypothetical protein
MLQSIKIQSDPIWEPFPLPISLQGLHQKKSAASVPSSHHISMFQHLRPDTSCLLRVGLGNGTTDLPTRKPSLKNRHGKRFDRRLLMSLSLIYRDVMRFRYKAHKLLSTGKGFRDRSGMIRKIFLQPFDDHLDSVHERLQWHSQLFKQEVQIS